VLFTTKYSLNLRVISAWIEYYTKTAEHKFLAYGSHKQKTQASWRKMHWLPSLVNFSNLPTKIFPCLEANARRFNHNLKRSSTDSIQTLKAKLSGNKCLLSCVAYR